MNDKNELVVYDNINKVSFGQILLLIIWIGTFLFLVSQIVLIVEHTLGNKSKEEVILYNFTYNTLDKFNLIKPSVTVKNYELNLAALGKITINKNIKNSKYESVNLVDLSKLSKGLKNYDFILANLNSPILNNNIDKTTIDSLKKLNISLLATASFNIADKREEGLISTVNNINKSGITQVGITKKDDENNTKRYAILKKNDISIGVLSYSTDFNVKSAEVGNYAVNILDENLILEDVKELRKQNVDLIISYIYIPKEDNLIATSSKQLSSFELLFNNGVDIVFGVGSDIVQEQTEEVIENNSGSKHVYGIYSLGDFLGNRVDAKSLISSISSININKEVRINRKGEMLSKNISFKVNKPQAVYTDINKNEKCLILLSQELKNYDSGKSNFSKDKYNKLSKLQNEFDEIYN